MRDFLVYLAGPIAGNSYDEAQNWRAYVAQELPKEIQAMSPLRAKGERLARQGVITDSYEDNPLTSQRGLTARDRMDCTRADMVIMNLLGAQKVTIGTMIEIGWADANRIPIILVIEPSGNVHDHPMVRECAAFRVETLDQAVAVCEAVLLPAGKGTVRELELEPTTPTTAQVSGPVTSGKVLHFMAGHDPKLLQLTHQTSSKGYPDSQGVS